MGEPLLGAGVRRRRIPCRRQIAGEPHQRLPDRPSGEAPRQHRLERCGPRAGRPAPAPLFQRVSSSRATSRLVGVDQLVAAGSQGGIVTRFLELTRQAPAGSRCRPARILIGGLDRGFDSVFRDGLHDLRGNGAIDPDAADADAQSGADMTVVAAAMVAVGMARIACRRRPASSGRSDRNAPAGQQGPTATRRLPRGTLLHMRVLRDQLLVRLVLFPADVAGVMIAQQDVPRPSASMAGGLAGAPVDDARALGRAAEHVGAGIDGIWRICSTVW